ncbi:MAG: class I SAM-dependent methyltransferase [Candidatus Lokiarchaeota archaeon]|nr:class I SAM-dependent methyltransferase [Candidatus Lokiarchaeota archaeon]
MSMRFYEISEGQRRILNPLSIEKIHLLGEICDLNGSTTILDLCSGKGEMLCQWSKKYGIKGIGVDISAVYHDSAVRCKLELNVPDNINFIRSDAVEYLRVNDTKYDIISCIGATWIGDGLAGTIKLMIPKMKNKDSTLLIGEPYWLKTPPEEVYKIYGFPHDLYISFAGTLERFKKLGFEVIEMVISNTDDWDRYMAQQWKNIYNWIKENPCDSKVEEIRKWNEKNRDLYFKYGREYLNWGVFILKQV